MFNISIAVKKHELLRVLELQEINFIKNFLFGGCSKKISLWRPPQGRMCLGHDWECPMGFLYTF